MPCLETGDCRQGRARCKTPITCSGFPVDEAIETFRRERPPRPIPAAAWPSPIEEQDEEIGLPVAVAVLVAAICIAAFICAVLGAEALGRFLGLF